MGKVFEGIDEGLAQWISAQPLWFVATAPLAAEGHVNGCPEGTTAWPFSGSTKWPGSITQAAV